MPQKRQRRKKTEGSSNIRETEGAKADAAAYRELTGRDETPSEAVDRRKKRGPAPTEYVYPEDRGDTPGSGSSAMRRFRRKVRRTEDRKERRSAEPKSEKLSRKPQLPFGVDQSRKRISGKALKKKSEPGWRP